MFARSVAWSVQFIVTMVLVNRGLEVVGDAEYVEDFSLTWVLLGIIHLQFI